MTIYFASSNSLQALQYLAKNMRTKEQSKGSELGRAIQVALTWEKERNKMTQRFQRMKRLW